jgi:hypothetical protein
LNILQEQSLTLQLNFCFSGSQTGVLGEPQGDKHNVKFIDIILLGSHSYEKVVKLNVDSRTYRKMCKNMPLATVLSEYMV